jgi:hypothetical protein
MRSEEAVDIVDTGIVTMCKCIHYRLHSFVNVPFTQMENVP